MMTMSRQEVLADLRERIADIDPPSDGSYFNPADNEVFTKIERLCAVRDRCAHELRERLIRDGFEPSLVTSAIDRAVSCGLVDDLRFADSYIRGKVSAGKGSYTIEKELMTRDIDPSCLSSWPDGYGLDDQSQLERAVHQLTVKPPTCKDKRAGAYRRLCTKGYTTDIAARASALWFAQYEGLSASGE